MNSNYQRGTRFERTLLTLLEKDGYSTLRTAGSHGFADIVALNSNHVRMIQCKVTKASKITLGTYSKDVAKILETKCPPTVTRELWIKMDRKEPYKVLIL